MISHMAAFASKIIRAILQRNKFDLALALDLTLRAENREQVAVFISEVGGPIGGRDLVGFADESDSLGGEGAVGNADGVDAEDDFGGAAEVLRGTCEAAREAQHDCSGLQ